MVNSTNDRIGLRRFSKLVCFSTLFLIFVGGMVTSTGSGLSVPDWPLSYGTFFPPMVGGVFYEHSHRMVASGVGLMTLILSIWLGVCEKRRWVKTLGFFALGAVIAQGILGGMTVLFFLPTWISTLHAVLAQTFFILTIIIAYSQSIERNVRGKNENTAFDPIVLKCTILTVVVIYLQLILGALMRHTHSGLAIPDFPTMGGSFVPTFDQKMLKTINYWRFNMNLEPVVMGQVFVHFIHRLGAVVVASMVGFLTYCTFSSSMKNQEFNRLVLFLNFLIIFQLCLGAFTVLSQKSPVVTSLHVVTGAALLGTGVLLVLRASPLTIPSLKKCIGANIGIVE